MGCVSFERVIVDVLRFRTECKTEGRRSRMQSKHYFGTEPIRLVRRQIGTIAERQALVRDFSRGSRGIRPCMRD